VEPHGIGKRVLVVDDDDIARELLSSILRDAGFEVFELPSPIGATQTLLNQEIDLLVLDVFMPSMDGDKLTKLLRSNRRLSKLFIVLVSGTGLEELSAMGRRVQANAVVPKADARRRLVEVVRASAPS
jgi:CheY-like chemotaxis protein